MTPHTFYCSNLKRIADLACAFPVALKHHLEGFQGHHQVSRHSLSRLLRVARPTPLLLLPLASPRRRTCGRRPYPLLYLHYLLDCPLVDLHHILERFKTHHNAFFHSLSHGGGVKWLLVACSVKSSLVASGFKGTRRNPPTASLLMHLLFPCGVRGGGVRESDPSLCGTRRMRVK